jgi:hypothetical protein
VIYLLLFLIPRNSRLWDLISDEAAGDSRLGLLREFLGMRLIYWPVLAAKWQFRGAKSAKFPAQWEKPGMGRQPRL